jgi:hypothetical protein
VLVATAPIGAAFAIDAASFLASTAMLLALRLGPEPLAAGSRGLLADLGSGWHELRSRTWLWSSIVLFGLSNLAIAPFYVLGPLVARDALGGATAWGLIMACTGADRWSATRGARCPPRRAPASGFLALSTCARCLY